MEMTEKQKAIEEEWRAQGLVSKTGKELEDTSYGRATQSKGPDWLEAEQDTVNPNIMAGMIMDMMGLHRRSGFVYNSMGQQVTDADIIETATAWIMPYLPEDASRLAKFSVLPAVQYRIKKLPMQEIDTADNSIGQYIKSGRMQEEIEAFTASGIVKTGFAKFDELAGGLFPGLYVIGAISSLGKTTYIHQMADQIAKAGRPVLFFSLEMSRLELATKSISRGMAQIEYKTAVSSTTIRSGYNSMPMQEAIAAYTDSIKDNLQIIEGSFDTTVESMQEYARAFMQQHNNTRPVIIVDYLQVIQGLQKGTTKDSMDYNIVELKRLSRSLSVPVIVISSINRANYLTKMDFESFKESGGIEYTADVVLGLQLACLDDAVFADNDDERKGKTKKRDAVKKAKAENPRRIKLVCLKNRYGGTDWTVEYKYFPKYDLFEETGGYTTINKDGQPIK